MDGGHHDAAVHPLMKCCVIDLLNNGISQLIHINDMKMRGNQMPNNGRTNESGATGNKDIP